MRAFVGLVAVTSGTGTSPQSAASAERKRHRCGSQETTEDRENNHSDTDHEAVQRMFTAWVHGAEELSELPGPVCIAAHQPRLAARLSIVNPDGSPQGDGAGCEQKSLPTA